MDLTLIAAEFLGSEVIVNITGIENGLINNTYLVETSNEKFILQKINTKIFTNPQAIQNNHLNINEHLEKSGYSKKIVQLIPTLTGNYLVENNNEIWRMMEYIDGSTTFIKAPNLKVVLEATKTLSEFYKILNQSPMILEETLPDFINFEKRIDDFKKSLVQENSRKILAENEINFLLEHLSLPEKWLALERNKDLPTRVIHADPKISNILFNKDQKATAVIDLDTMMNGTILYDFGDMIRSYTNNAEEDNGSSDENFNAETYKVVKEGFMEHLADTLTAIESKNLDYAAKVVIYIQALRFMTDFLKGDVYYNTAHEMQNLYRASNQINLLKGLITFLKY